MRSSTVHKKALMLSLFWDANGVILADFADSDVRIDSEHYSKLAQQTRKLRRKSRVCDLFYLCDNAPVHTSAVSTEVIRSCGFTVLQHAPYSPDLAPQIFFSSIISARVGHRV